MMAWSKDIDQAPRDRPILAELRGDIGKTFYRVVTWKAPEAHWYAGEWWDASYRHNAENVLRWIDIPDA